jgi:hypothetical protein
MDGCNTFAYVDGSLAQTRAKIDPDGPAGTKYMDFVTNAMPSFFSSMADASMSLIRGLMSTSDPMTHDTIVSQIDATEMVLVTGEEDNVFHPGMPSSNPMSAPATHTRTSSPPRRARLQRRSYEVLRLCKARQFSRGGGRVEPFAC